MPESTTETVTVTETALEKINGLRAGEDDAEGLGLRIEITGVRGADYTYDLAFELLAETDPSDIRIDAGSGLTVVVPEKDLAKLNGSTLDLPSNGEQPGLVLRNPNRPDVGPGSELDLSGSVVEQVEEVLSKRINPSIAAHGGFANLVKVEGDTAFVLLGGGCQGCGMASATVQAGIESTLKELVPAINNVIDATDHESGENPYYAQA
ncbi:MAG: Fe/S biogenesis protein NfuA [Candidatus Poriferisodalaceae bacterium]|jgi:Fe/S biogenesis protein NfuA